MAGIYLPDLKIQKNAPMVVTIFPNGFFSAVVDDWPVGEGVAEETTSCYVDFPRRTITLIPDGETGLIFNRFVPCKRNKDNAIGLWDTKDGKFLVLEKTGGDDVERPAIMMMHNGKVMDAVEGIAEHVYSLIEEVEAEYGSRGGT